MIYSYDFTYNKYIYIYFIKCVVLTKKQKNYINLILFLTLTPHVS